MAILDAKGRLFGKMSILDVGALLVIALVIIGVFFLPGDSGSLAQLNVKTQPVEVDLLVRGLSISNPDSLLKEFATDKKTSIIIRNQPYGEAEILTAKELPRTVSVSQPDGSVKALPDPRPEAVYSSDFAMTLRSDAEITDDGVVFGNNKVKIGTVLRLEGYSYDFNGSVIDVRILNNK